MLSFSQNTWKPKLINDSLIAITSSQLKQTNIIFLEHKQLKLINKELLFQLENYQLLYTNSLKIDSLNKEVISKLSLEVIKKDLQVQEQAIKIDKQKSTIRYLTIGGIVAILTATFLK